MDLGLTRRAALVPAASRGLGRAYALALAAEGRLLVAFPCSQPAAGTINGEATRTLL